MRWFWAGLAIVVLIAVDRAYMDGQIAQAAMSLARWVGGFFTQWADDLLRPLRH